MSCWRSAVEGGLLTLTEFELELLELYSDAYFAAPPELDSASASLDSSLGKGS